MREEQLKAETARLKQIHSDEANQKEEQIRQLTAIINENNAKLQEATIQKSQLEQKAANAPMQSGFVPSPPKPKSEVERFLVENSLQEWASTLAAAGYDDLQDLKIMVTTNTGAFEKLIGKPGHRLKMSRLLST
eukprot:TRINITY_DN10163_c0_g2_i3.p1 TRINITY_DN10163_c0_g2~~TRINITY_DN10163_c0_g2_i3.p1  ORF type:complete len:134 (-),score=25.60 TRINITY_DN10163_c0_g2_i3:126-527(-)